MLLNETLKNFTAGAQQWASQKIIWKQIRGCMMLGLSQEGKKEQILKFKTQSRNG